MPSYRLLSAPAARAISVWGLWATSQEINAAFRKVPALHSFSLCSVGAGQGFDEGLLWHKGENRSPPFEVHLHGGQGIASTFSSWLESLNWQELISSPNPLQNRFLQARGLANALWASRALHGDPPAAPSWQAVLENPPKVVLAGPTNVGKSTLMNAWLGADRVTVSPHPGTTRDSVEVGILMGEGEASAEVRLVDTAGFGVFENDLDQAALIQTREACDQAWKVVWLCDAYTPPIAPVAQWVQSSPSAHLRVLLRADLEETWCPEDLWPGPWIRGSCHQDAPTLLAEIEQALFEPLGILSFVR